MFGKRLSQTNSRDYAMLTRSKQHGHWLNETGETVSASVGAHEMLSAPCDEIALFCWLLCLEPEKQKLLFPWHFSGLGGC